jgi:hypothetical protein
VLEGAFEGKTLVEEILDVELREGTIEDKLNDIIIL